MKESVLVEEIVLEQFLENKPWIQSYLVADTKDSGLNSPFEFSLDEP